MPSPGFLKAPKDYPFFYGWIIVVIATIGTLASIPGQTIGVGVFTAYLIDSLQIERLDLSIAYGIGTVSSSFCLPMAGTILDRIGARAMVVFSSVGLGISLTLLAFIDSILGGLGGLFSLRPGSESWPVFIIISSAFFFFILRFTGQGCLTLVCRYSIGKWFNRKRVLAATVSGVAISIGFNASPEILNRMIGATSWWLTLVILAIVIGVGMSIIGWLFLSDNPEDEGLIPDGCDYPNQPQSSEFTINHEFTRREALATSSFWICCLAFASHALLATAFGFHVADIAPEFGLSRDAVYSVYIPMGFVGIIGTLLSGYLCNRFPLYWTLSVFCLTQFLGTWGVIFYDQNFGWALIVGGFGIGNGMFINLITVVFPRYFGREHLGAISGFNTFTMVFASATGPLLFSIMYHFLSSYSMAMAFFLVIPGILTPLSLFVRNPQIRLVGK